ncbi:MAG: Hsp20/alpha crystallin family protein [Planctomycetaceae bacterium]
MSRTLPEKTSRREISNWFGRDPFSALREEMDDALSRFSLETNGDWMTGEHIPSLDLSETETHIEVKIDVPGVKPEEIEVEVMGNTLRVSGEHQEEKEEQDRKFYRMERKTGFFSRTIALPASVDEDHVDAQCQNGVLTIRLAKMEEAGRKKIKVKG